LLRENRKPGLDATILKLIALIIMTVDHIGAYGINIPFVWENYMLLRQIGRLAAPLFLFAFTESMRHTHDRRAFFFRIYKASVIVGLLNTLLGHLLGCSFGNIFQTFAWLSAAVFCVDKLRKSGSPAELMKLLLIAVAAELIDRLICASFFDFTGASLVRGGVRAFLCSPVMVEYSLGMIALGAAWYYIGNRFLCAGLLVLLSIPAYFGFMQTPELTMFSGIQYCMAAAAIFIMLYNGEKGRGMKNFFYIYYPLHVYLIAAINRFI